MKWRSFANQPKSASIGITYLASSQLPSGWEVNSSALANSSGFNVGLIAAGHDTVHGKLASLNDTCAPEPQFVTAFGLRPRF